MTTKPNDQGISISFNDIADYLFKCAQNYTEASYQSKEAGKHSESIIQLVAAGCLLSPLREFLEHYPSTNEGDDALLKATFAHYDAARSQILAAFKDKQNLH